MPKPRQTDSDDTTRVDSYRTDEDTGGAAAPPLRPADEVERDKRHGERDETTKRGKR